MVKDCSTEVKDIIKNYQKEDIEYGKPLDFLTNRLKASKDDIEEDILNCSDLVYTEKQEKDGEIRYALFLVYSRKKGRKYLINFRNKKLRIITAFPLGRRTLRRYKKKGLYT